MVMPFFFAGFQLCFEFLQKVSCFVYLQEDPAYLGDPTPPKPKPRAPASFEDEEKSRLLQQLLQSKKPEDINKANALIKSMVKEDERRMERTSRRIVEVCEASLFVFLLKILKFQII